MAFESSFEGKSVLVTGAGKGIGNAVARKLASLGALVYAVSRTEKDLENLRFDFPANVFTICLDLSDWDAVHSQLGLLPPMDVVLNIAGVGTPQPFLNITSHTFDSIIKSNLKSVLAVSQVAAKGMIKHNKRGAIVNMSSRMAKKAFQDFAIYSASKAALDSLTRTMALELGGYGIRVNSVNLGAVWTRMWADEFDLSPEGQHELNEFISKTSRRNPLGKAFVPMDDVVNTLLFLASNQTSMLTGENLALEGGFCIT